MQSKAHPQSNMLNLVLRIQPLDSEISAAKKHLLSIRKRLSTSFEVSKVIKIGSHARGTAVRWYSDLDVLAVLRRKEAKWGSGLVSSTTLITNVRDDLDDRYVRTGVRRDQQAVVVGFSSKDQSLDVVPAIFKRIQKLRPIYDIPDGSGGWIETSPEAHNNYFTKSNDRSNGKLKKVIQLLKWWKYAREQSIPIQSFHLDLLLASNEICVGVKPYTQCLYEAFKLLADRECRGLRDPVGVAGVVYAAATDAQRVKINNSVNYALDHSKSAILAAKKNDFEEANRQWSLVFNGNF